MIPRISIIALAACGGATWPQAPPEQGVVVSSAAVGDDFEIHVMTPDDYDASNERYPVVYFLDAYDTQVGVVRDRLASLPPVIAVGIGYPADDYRNRDLGFPADPAFSDSGGADRFYDFLDTELVPMIDTQYRTDDRRVLVGHSLGGYFTMYALLQTTPSHRPFTGFVALSPALQFASGWIFGLEREVAARESDLPVALYCNAGELEAAYFNAYVDELAERLSSRGYPSLALHAEHVPEANHCCTEERGWAKGLPFVLR